MENALELDKPFVKKRDDPLLETSKIIYVNHLKNAQKGRLIIILASIVLTIMAILTICLLQYSKYTDFKNKNYENKTIWLCYASQISNIDMISTPISFVLILFYIVIYKRRVLMRDRFKFRNFGIPMMSSCWKKVKFLF